MARLSSLLLPDRPTVCHDMSRTALPGLPFNAIGKDDFLARLKSLFRIYFTEILGLLPDGQTTNPINIFDKMTFCHYILFHQKNKFFGHISLRPDQPT